MTTDDGLKGLTDLQWFQIYAAMDDALLKFEMTEPATAVNPYLEKRRATAANAARQWLAANVDDSEQLSESDKDIALGQAVTFAEYVSEHAKGKMVEAAQKFLSMDYSKEIAKRRNVHDSGDSDAARYRFCATIGAS